MLTRAVLLAGTLLTSSIVDAQVFARELGDFDLKLATQPSRSMAQGLAQRDNGRDNRRIVTVVLQVAHKAACCGPRSTCLRRT